MQQATVMDARHRQGDGVIAGFEQRAAEQQGRRVGDVGLLGSTRYGGLDGSRSTRRNSWLDPRTDRALAVPAQQRRAAHL